MKKDTVILLLMLTILFSEMGYAKIFLVSSVDELTLTQPKVQPGDSILFSNKTWVDAQIELKVAGTATMPVRVMPPTVGAVILSGSSALKISGSNTIVKVGPPFNNISTRDFCLKPDSLLKKKEMTGRVWKLFT